MDFGNLRKTIEEIEKRINEFIPNSRLSLNLPRDEIFLADVMSVIDKVVEARIKERQTTNL